MTLDEIYKPDLWLIKPNERRERYLARLRRSVPPPRSLLAAEVQPITLETRDSIHDLRSLFYHYEGKNLGFDQCQDLIRVHAYARSAYQEYLVVETHVLLSMNEWEDGPLSDEDRQLYGFPRQYNARFAPLPNHAEDSHGLRGWVQLRDLHMVTRAAKRRRRAAPPRDGGELLEHPAVRQAAMVMEYFKRYIAEIGDSPLTRRALRNLVEVHEYATVAWDEYLVAVQHMAEGRTEWCDEDFPRFVE